MASAAQRRAYRKKLDETIDRAARLDAAERRELLRLIDRTRKEVLAQVADTDWKRANLGAQRQRLETLAEELARDLRLSLASAQDARWGEALDIADGTLAAMAGERVRQPLNPRTLAALRNFSADLIVEVADRVRQRAGAAIAAGVLGQKPSTEIIAEIGRSLTNADGTPAPGIWGDVATRAEVVYRTETNRVMAVATQARYEQANEQTPGLKKRWLHSGGAINPRRSHLEAERDYRPGGDPGPIPVGDMFELHVGPGEAKRGLRVGTYRCMYPRDPRLPAGHAVLCSCAMAPWREEWT